MYSANNSHLIYTSLSTSFVNLNDFFNRLMTDFSLKLAIKTRLGLDNDENRMV